LIADGKFIKISVPSMSTLSNFQIEKVDSFLFFWDMKLILKPFYWL